MRKAKYIFALACIALAAAACQKEPEPQPIDEPLKIIIRAGAPETRTAITGDGQGHYTPSWSANDSIGVYFTNISDAPTAFVNATAGTVGHFSAATTISGLSGTQTLYAFYPRGAFASTANTTNVIRVNVKDTQKPDGLGTFDKAADLLVARPYSGEFSNIGTEQTVDLAFARVLSVVKITPADATSVDAQSGRRMLYGEHVKSISIQYDGSGSDAPLTGRVEMNLSTGEFGTWTIKNYSATATYDDEVFALDGANAAFLLVNPITIAGGKSVTFTVTTENFVTSKTFTLGNAGMTFPAGNIATIGLSINDNWDIQSNSNIILQVPFTANISTNTTYDQATHGNLGATGSSKSSVSYTFSGSDQLRNNTNRIPDCGSFYWCSSATGLVISGINTGEERFFNLSFDSKLIQNQTSAIEFSLSADGSNYVTITSVNATNTTAANYGFNFSIPAGEHTNLRLKIENTGSYGAVIDNLTITRLDQAGANNIEVNLPSDTPAPDPDPEPTESVVYTLTPASGSNSNYASNCDIAIGGITWNLTGNSTYQPWRLGGKSLSNVNRALYSKTALNYDISKIVITHGAASNITVNSMTVIVASDASFSNVVSTLTPTFVANGTVTVNRPENVSWENCYYKIVYNVTVSGGSNRFIEFTKAEFYAYTTPTPGPTPEPSAQPGYLNNYEVPTVSLADATSYTTTGTETFGSTNWYEYDTQSSTQKIVTHTYAYSNKVYRNYTALVDQTKRCALWTAYVMHSGAYPNNNVDRGSFNEKTSYDPAIPKSWQSSGATSDYSSGNGYARGHHCASEDRQTTTDANNQTFYYTNQATQWQSGFNCGIWSSLEGRVQSTAPSGRDTMYVVVGTVFEGNRTHDSNDGGNVGLPSHFYKLIMKCSFDTNGTMTDAKGIAFLYTNEAHSGNYYDAAYVKSIDAIETLTGFDFFPRVPSELQSAAEVNTSHTWFTGQN